jgi:mono/diheme cytochrome c family protein
MPQSIKYALLLVTALALIPPALIARFRAMPSEKPRVHYFQDMDNQPKFRAQAATAIFADGRAMRPPVPGTIARGHLEDDDHYHRGVMRTVVGGSEWASAFPSQVTVDLALLRRGQDRFNIYCTPCHGYSGHGDGIIHQRADQLVIAGINGSTWVAPKSLHEKAIREQPVGQIYNSITNGVRTMSGYAAQVPVADRWAIVAYVRALQRSQHASPNDLPRQSASAAAPEKGPATP